MIFKIFYSDADLILRFLERNVDGLALLINTANISMPPVTEMK